MCVQHCDRREFLAGMGLSAATLLWQRNAPVPRTHRPRRPDPHVAINQWSVGAMRGRDKKRPGMSLDEELAGLAACGINGLEPGLQTPEQAEALAAQLAKHGLEMRSVYTGSELLDPAAAEKEIERILALAKRAKAVGTKIIVTNPSPLPNRRGKTDAQLEAQAAGLNRLGRELAALGVTLAYHNHDVELEHAAREFHHMMLGTEPGCLSLCLDAHWVYRGAGHSQVALFDVVKLYGQRVAELHLRQSKGNVWSETFGDGDIDYRALWKTLVGNGRQAAPGPGAGPGARDAPDDRGRRGPSPQLPLRRPGLCQQVVNRGRCMHRARTNRRTWPHLALVASPAPGRYNDRGVFEVRLCLSSTDVGHGIMPWTRTNLSPHTREPRHDLLASNRWVRYSCSWQAAGGTSQTESWRCVGGQLARREREDRSGERCGCQGTWRGRELR